MEIMGLVVIVLLITVAIFFVIRFVVFADQDDHLSDFTRTQTAANLISAMRKTTTECNGLSYEELIQACATNPYRSCGARTVCSELEGISEFLLAKTLREWGDQDYYFRIFNAGSDYVEKSSNDRCSRQSVGALKQEFVPSSAGIVTIELKICG